ncbi:MAG: peptidase Ste24p [Solirubrobacterales bacterium]|nr:peptidase Ste24p [Solirubrobacterales bacterium]
MFRLHLVIGVGGVLAAAASVATAAASVHHARGGADEVVLSRLHFTYPTFNLAALLLLLLAAAGSAVMAVALRACWQQRRAYRRFMHRLGVIGPLDGHPTVTLIDDSRPLAFCAGYLRPRVYISRSTLEVLSDTELEAVVAHEHHHRRVRDPLRFAFARVVGQALFFLPVLRPLGDRYGLVAELNADDAAVRASAGDKAPLAAAMLAFDSSGPSQGAGISPERVDSLLGEAGQWRLPVSWVAASVLALSCLAALMWRASEVASTHASFNLPVLSSEPCLVVLTLLLLVVCILVLPRRESGGRVARTPGVPLAH